MHKKLYILIAFLVVETLVIVLLTGNNNSKKQQILDDASHLVETQYATVYNSFGTLANTVFKGYIDKKPIREVFASRNRDGLYKLLIDDYRYLSSINFKQIHFHLPNNHSFLRMHKPKKFGDDLTKIRYSVDYVNTEKKPILGGLEMGKVVPGFRYVYPLHCEDKHVGSVETSFSVHSFANQMEKAYDVHTHFLMKKDVLNEKVFKGDKQKYTNSIENEDYVALLKPGKREKIIEAKEGKLANLYKKELKHLVYDGISTKKTFSFEIALDHYEDGKHNHIHKIATFLPLKNIQLKHIAYFVVYQDSKTLADLESELFISYIVASLIVMLIFLGLYKELMAKEILEDEVKRKTQDIQDMAAEVEENSTRIEEMNQELEVRIKEEVEKNAEAERKLAHQSKQAALGDMIGNIAHQWRQPLSAISSAASGMQLSKEVGILEDGDFDNFTDGIIKHANYLSRTIDDFRDFIKSEKKFEEFDVNDAIEKCLSVVNSSINNHKLHVITNFKDGLKISNYRNELQQAIINIFTNAKDALKDRVEKEEDRIIFIDTYNDNEKVYIKIKDTAGGIPESIMDRIFEPYFTTKHQAQGTGLGLYMTHQIVIESMNGGLDVENVDFEYNGKSYSGAQVVLSFKQDIKIQ